MDSFQLYMSDQNIGSIILAAITQVNWYFRSSPRPKKRAPAPPGRPVLSGKDAITGISRSSSDSSLLDNVSLSSDDTKEPLDRVSSIKAPSQEHKQPSYVYDTDTQSVKEMTDTRTINELKDEPTKEKNMAMTKVDHVPVPAVLPIQRKPKNHVYATIDDIAPERPTAPPRSPQPSPTSPEAKLINQPTAAPALSVPLEIEPDPDYEAINPVAPSNKPAPPRRPSIPPSKPPPPSNKPTLYPKLPTLDDTPVEPSDTSPNKETEKVIVKQEIEDLYAVVHKPPKSQNNNNNQGAESLYDNVTTKPVVPPKKYISELQHDSKEQPSKDGDVTTDVILDNSATNATISATQSSSAAHNDIKIIPINDPSKAHDHSTTNVTSTSTPSVRSTPYADSTPNLTPPSNATSNQNVTSTPSVTSDVTSTPNVTSVSNVTSAPNVTSASNVTSSPKKPRKLRMAPPPPPDPFQGKRNIISEDTDL